MPSKQMLKHLIALAGEYLVAGRLSAMGYVASLTLKNYPGVDIFCLNPDNEKQVAIQVKTIRHGHHYFVSKHVGDFKTPFVFVHLVDEISAEFFVASSEEVAKLSKEQHDGYQEKHPENSKDQPWLVHLHDLEPYRDCWEKLELGRGDSM